MKEDGVVLVQSQWTRVIPYLVRRMHGRLQGSPLENFIPSNAILVPAPRSSPTKSGSLHPTKVICRQMIEHGIGGEMKELLERSKAVPKAAIAKTIEDRPTVQEHFSSMKIMQELGVDKPLVLVDDVVTTGAMLLASVSRLQEAFPNYPVYTFALFRTIGGGEEVSGIDEPCRGRIRLRGERALRAP
jgi:predicted amidophosphoribosyltransferase